jgi:hypothetical protein
MPSISSCRARLYLELLEERCLLSFGLGATVQVSDVDPFAGSTADDPQHQTGTLYPGSALETFLVVDPTNPDHLAGIWQQDRWSNGGARGLVVGVSFDGGQSWQDAPIPGLTLVSGGTALRASDPWLAFASNGDLFAAALELPTLSTMQATVSKSTDGGLTWQAPVVIPGSSGADKESIMTDPSDPLTAYVVWTGAFSRTTDGGQTFTPARGLPTGSGSQIVVLPDGTLVDSDGCEVFRSTDRGQTWGPRILVGNCDPRQVIDPNTHQPLRAGLGLGDIAVDPSSGALYVVIEDASFSGGRYDSIAFTQSLDGGLTWSTPVAVNQTPPNVPPPDQQAFIPTVQVAADGTVGVAYYDFRYNQQGPDLPTDFWFVPGTPDGSGGIAWGNELRLTDGSFNFEDAPFSVYGKFVGDYQGRASAGNDLLNLFCHPFDGSWDGVFFRRVINQGGASGGGAGHLVEHAPGLAAVLWIGPAGAYSPVALAPDRSALQPWSVDVLALPDLFLHNPAPSATRFTGESQGLRRTAPLHSLDVTMPAVPFSGDLWNVPE